MNGHASFTVAIYVTATVVITVSISDTATVAAAINICSVFFFFIPRHCRLFKRIKRYRVFGVFRVFKVINRFRWFQPRFEVAVQTDGKSATQGSDTAHEVAL